LYELQLLYDNKKRDKWKKKSPGEKKNLLGYHRDSGEIEKQPVDIQEKQQA